MIPVKLRTYRALVRFGQVEHVYVVKARNRRHAKQLVFNEAEAPAWQSVIDELLTRYSAGPFTGNHPQISWGISTSAAPCGKKPKRLYSVDLRTGVMS